MKIMKVLVGLFLIVLIIIGGIIFSNLEGLLWSKESDNSHFHTEGILEINVALWDYEVVGYDKKLIDEFAQRNSHIKVNVINIPNDKYDNNLTMMLSNGKDIDVFYARTPFEYSKIVQNNFARPLDDLVLRDNIDTKLYEKALKVNNNIYGIPYRSDFMVLYYNKNIFDENKVAYPSGNITWAGYREMAKKLTSASKKDKVYGIFIEPQLINRVILSMIKSGDFDILSSDFNMLREGLEFIVNMQYTDKTAVSYAKNKELNANQLVFTKGSSAMSINGTWFLNYLINDRRAGRFDFNWGMVSYPDNQQNKPDQIIYTPVCINKKSKNIAASWEFVKFITSKEGAKILAKEIILPAYIDDSILEILQGHPEFPREGLSMLQNYRVKPYLNTIEPYDQVSKMVFEEIELMITNNKSIDEGIGDMIIKRQEILNASEIK